MDKKNILIGIALCSIMLLLAIMVFGRNQASIRVNVDKANSS
jgi:hypothetical protein